MIRIIYFSIYFRTIGYFGYFRYLFQPLIYYSLFLFYAQVFRFFFSVISNSN